LEQSVQFYENLWTLWRKCGSFLGKTCHLVIGQVGALFALETEMSSSFDSIYKKMASSLEAGGPGHLHEAKLDPARHISPVIAHELNNILTIIQGYTDRMLMKHGENPSLRADLLLISENTRRAVSVVRQAAPRQPAIAA
jgi:hypothetical protein